MARHNAAIGNRAVLEQHSTVRLAGTMSMPAMGMEATVEVFRGKPNKMLQRIGLGAMGEMTQGFDGTVAWVLPPAGMEAQVQQGEAAEQARTQADFFSNFQDPNHYAKAETVELTDFEGKKCYKVKVTRGTREGIEYFDSATGLLAGIQGSQSTPMGPVEYTTVMREYKEVDGVKFPSKIEQRAGPQTVVMTFTQIEFDKVDSTVFALPDAVKAKIRP